MTTPGVSLLLSPPSLEPHADEATSTQSKTGASAAVKT
jgi:hypothetical protein